MSTPNVSLPKRNRTFRRKIKVQKGMAQSRLLPAEARMQKSLRQQDILAIVRKELLEDKNRADFGVAGYEFIECVTNPLGTGMPGGRPVLTRAPTGSSEFTALLRVVGTTQFLGSTATSCLIQFTGHNVASTTADQDLHITYGADATDPAAVMTAVAEAFCQQYSLMGTLWPQNDYGRMITCAIRVKATSPLDSTSGSCVAYESSKLLRSAAANYVQNQYFFSTPIGSVNDIKEGILVRRSYDDEALTFVTPNANPYGTRTVFGKLPIVQLSGLSATTVISITWSAVYEVIPSLLTPLALQRPAFEPEMAEIIHLINAMPQVTTADSFTSFIKAAFKAVGRAAKWVWDHKKNIADAVEAGSAVVKSFG